MKRVFRKALASDVESIQFLINEYAKRGLLLPRSLNSVFEHLRDFWVCEEDKKIVGVCALSIAWDNLAEIRSLAVKESKIGQGIGSELVKRCIEEAKELGIRKVFTLTYQVNFFKKLGFRIIEKEQLPQKIWKDCINCVKFPNCDETAMEIEI
jgi:amino-acid N-acetyltransferase